MATVGLVALVGGVLPGGLVPTPAAAAVGDLTTLAGATATGYLGDCGPATEAGLIAPRRIAMAADGPVVSMDDHRVVQVVDGEVRVVAGNGTTTSSGSGGPAVDAGLGAIGALASRGDERFYVAETDHHRVRSVSLATGTIFNFAGTGVAGSSGIGGPALLAQLSSPSAIGVAPGSNLVFIADRDPVLPFATGGRIRSTSWPAGNLNAVVDGLEAPIRSLATNGMGTVLYFTDGGGARIWRYDISTGTTTKIAGTGTPGYTGDGGPAVSAAVDEPHGLVVAEDDKALLFADSGNHRIRRIDLVTGTITTIAGSGADGSAGDGGDPTAAEVGEPFGVAVDDSGAWWVTQIAGERVRTLEGGRIVTAAGGGATPGGGICLPSHQVRFNNPGGSAVDAAGNVYVADRLNNRVRRIDAGTGFVRTVAGTGTAGFSGDGGPAVDAALNGPRDVEIDHAGRLVIVDASNLRIRRVDLATGIITTIAGNGVGSFAGDGGPAVAASIRVSETLAVDPMGRIVLADTQNHRVRRIDLDGTITTIAGNGTNTTGGDGGAAASAGIAFPWGVAVDPAGNVFVSQRDAHRVRRIDAGTGVITTVLGDGVGQSTGDGGLASAARVSSPRGVHADAAGAVFVADNGGNRLRRLDPTTGVVTTVAGNGTLSPTGDGVATAVALTLPTHVTGGVAAGDLLISQSNRIRRLEGVDPVGQLRVTTNPAVPAVISVDGTGRDSWGLTWLEMPIGTRQVCFGPIPGFTTPPCEDVVVSPGATSTVEGSYQPRGYLQVSTSPALPATIFVDGVPRNDWGMWTEVDPGSYEVCYGEVEEFLPPPCEVVVVPAGVTKSVVGVFSPKPAADGPSGHGLLRVTTSPAVASRITIDGEFADTWGLTWVKLPPATYEVCFEPVLHATTPPCEDVAVVEGQTATLEGTFVPHGFLQVSTDPAVHATIYVNGQRTNGYGVYTSREPGTYHVCFGPVPGSAAVPPPCQTVDVIAGLTTSVTGTYG